MSVYLFYFIFSLHGVHNPKDDGRETKENESQPTPSPRIMASTDRIEGGLLGDPAKSEGVGREEEDEKDDTHKIWLGIVCLIKG